jgi:hypothetical protein
MFRNPLIILLLLSLMPLTSIANDYDYPELMVSPRATERLQLELDRENQGKLFANQLGSQIAYGLTLVNGIMMMGNTNEVDDADKNASKLGLVVGAVGLGATMWMARSYSPYSDGLRNANRITGKDKRAQLGRERLAEEAINDAAKLGKRLDYIAMGSTLVANLYMASVVEADTLTEPLTYLGAATSILPIIFKNYWTKVSNSQNSYKKKVYGPIGFNTILFDKASKTYMPGASLAFSF